MSRLSSAALLFCLSLGACQGSDSAGGIGGLALEATAAVAPPPPQNVVVTAKVTNISSNTVHVEWGSCSVVPVFHTASLAGPVVYDARTLDCGGVAHPATLDPDQSVQMAVSWLPNLPPGKYFVEVVITVNGETTSVGAGTVTF